MLQHRMALQGNGFLLIVPIGKCINEFCQSLLIVMWRLLGTTLCGHTSMLYRYIDFLLIIIIIMVFEIYSLNNVILNFMQHTVLVYWYNVHVVLWTTWQQQTIIAQSGKSIVPVSREENADQNICTIELNINTTYPRCHYNQRSTLRHHTAIK